MDINIYDIKKNTFPRTSTFRNRNLHVIGITHPQYIPAIGDESCG